MSDLVENPHCWFSHAVQRLNYLSETLHNNLDAQIQWNFPNGIVKLIRLPKRVGLIIARLEGLKHVTAEVVSFFDCHMEVNTNW